MNRHFVFLVILLAACNPVKSVKEAFVKLSPYDRYVKNLETASLQNRPMVKEWLAAGQRSMTDSVFIRLPFSETGHFLSHKPEARGYRFEARDGQILTVNGATTATGDATIFLDLFIWKDNEWKHQTSADSMLSLSHEFSNDATCLLRVQPELLVNAYYSLAITLTPVLINPVSGASNKSIQSFYGDSRDGGKRLHEGVDIFARKGTPVIAPTDGMVSRTGYTRLGGKVVWMYDRKRQHSYYFAHLDSQYVSQGAVVKQGDTLGTVGNTGNARFTPPHLHFGIYQARSKDPINFIRTLESVILTSPVDTTFQTKAFRVKSSNVHLRSGPDEKLPAILPLEKSELVRVVAKGNQWYRVVLANQVEGYVQPKQLVSADTGPSLPIQTIKEIRADAGVDAVVIGYTDENSTLEVLGHFGVHRYIRTGRGLLGWITL